MPKQTFYPFQRLPFEIRLLIWELAFLQSRLIDVFVHDYFYGRLPNHEAKRKYHPGFQITYPVLRTHGERLPHLFRINTETRELARKSYEICLSTVIDPATRFDPIQLHSRKVCRDAILRQLEGFKNYILPSSINAKRIKHKHRRRTAKGIYFQPGVDKIYFRFIPNTPDFSFCMHNIGPSALKTENINSLVMDRRLCRGYSPTFSTLCVPHIFPFSPTSSISNPEHLLANLTEFVLAYMGLYENEVIPELFSLEQRWPRLDMLPRTIEGYGLRGRLEISPVFQYDLEGRNPDGEKCVDVQPRLAR